MPKYLFRFLIWGVGAVIISEIFFRTIIPATQTPRIIYDSEYGFHKYDPTYARTGMYTRGSTAEVKAPWHINSQGWNAATEFVVTQPEDKTVVAIIGDSITDGLFIDVDQRFDQVAQTALGDDVAVYAFGYKGNNLATMLRVMEYTQDTFAPDVIVFQFSDDEIRRSYDDPDKSSRQLHLGCAGSELELLLPEPYSVPLQSVVYDRVATLSYLRFNRRIDFGDTVGDVVDRVRSVRDVFSFVSPTEDISDATEEAVLDDGCRVEDLETEVTRYLADWLAQQTTAQNIVLLLGVDPETVYESPEFSDFTQGHLFYSELSDQLQSQTSILELHPIFYRDYQQTQRRHDYTFDSHWDAYGNDVVGRALAEHLLEILGNDS